MIRRARTVLAIAILALAVAAAEAPAAPPHLSYARARSAIQHRADRFADTPTTITSIFHRLDQTYSGHAEWKHEDPTGCSGCGYDPVSGQFYDTPATESCSVDLRAKLLRSGQVRVSVEDFACY